MDLDLKRELERRDRAIARLPEAAAAERAARNELELAAAEALHAGMSYAELGRHLGISRQAARKRWPGLSSW
jgi:hypothetical protein